MTNKDSETVEQQLLYARQKNQQAERLAGLGFWEWDFVEDCLTHCSEGYARMLDLTVEETIAASASTELDHHFVHAEDLQRYKEEELRTKERGVGIDIKYRVITAKGLLRYLHEVSELVKNDSGEVIRATGIVQDITDSILVQEELTKMLADARRAERMAKLGTYTWNWPEGKIVACSEEFARLQEMTVEQVLERFIDLEADHKAIHADDRESFAEMEAAALARGEGYTAQYRMLLPSGGMRHIREVCEVELNNLGEVVRSMGSIQDITEQVELQEQLRQVLKIKALGQLTGGVAHDFNNMLMVILGNVDLAMEMLGEENPSIELLAGAKDAAERCAVLTRRLLAFSRKQPLQMKIIDLQSLILGMKDLLQSTLGETIQVEIQETGHIWLSETDDRHLESALLNLAINARDAMPDGGSLRIELDGVVLDDNYVSAYEDLNAGTYTRLAVSDTGVGMSSEVLAQAFDPFYTTKGVGEGTGLGLSMVYGFIKQCHGHVCLYSEPNRGTVVKLYLPACPNGTIETPVERAVKNTRGSKEQILVVEDDAEVRKLAVRLVNELGYRTVEAENAAEALHQLRSEPSIALLFSDVVLPGGMNGVELAEEACLSYPDLKVLFTSGYTGETVERWGKTGYGLLEKPYSKVQLASLLSQALGSANPSTTDESTTDSKRLGIGE